jgi:tetratricopeptide (TPR) repeat protein
MVVSSQKKVRVFVFLGIGFGLFIGSLLLINANNKKSVSKTISQDLLLANNSATINQIDSQGLPGLDERKTVADSVDLDIASELQVTENNNELKGFLAATEVNSVIAENKPETQDKLDLKIDPAKTHYDRGLLYSIYQKYPEAIASYDRALALNPQLTLGYYHRGIAREKLGEVARAIEDFQKAQSLAQEQNDPTALEMARHKLDYLIK